MRKVIIIVLVLLLVGGGGAVGLVMLGIVRNPLKPPTAAELDAVAKAAAEADAKAKAAAFQAPLAALTIVKVGDLVIPLFGKDGKSGRAFVTSRLIIDTQSKAAVQDGMPKLVDRLLGDFVPYFQKRFAEGDTIDLAVIKKKVRRHAKDVFGDKVKDVLLVNVFSEGGDRQSRGTPYDID